MPNIFFTSDTHYGHPEIIEKCDRPYHSFRQRPQYETVKEMNEDMVERWNARVKDNDLVYHLGDVGMGTPEDYAGYIRRCRGGKIVLRGNHDCSAGKLVQRVGFNRAAEQDFIVAGGYTLWLAHIPVSSFDHRPLTRPTPWMPYDISLCGHVHCAWKHNTFTKEINVGVDQWDMAPVSLEEVIDYYERVVNPTSTL